MCASVSMCSIVLLIKSRHSHVRGLRHKWQTHKRENTRHENKAILWETRELAKEITYIEHKNIHDREYSWTYLQIEIIEMIKKEKILGISAENTIYFEYFQSNLIKHQQTVGPTPWKNQISWNLSLCCEIGVACYHVEKKGVVRWDLGPISSGYLAHCSHPFFMSIYVEFSGSYSMLSQSLVTPTSLARLFINPEFCQCPLRCWCQLQLFWYLQQTACICYFSL